MAFDMLKRLSAHEIIVEILLEQGKVIDAIRLAREYTNTDFIAARKFLEAALKSEDKMIFFSVFNFLTERNQRLRGNCEFMKSKTLHIWKLIKFNYLIKYIFILPTDEQCENYVKAYKEMFPTSVN